MVTDNFDNNFNTGELDLTGPGKIRPPWFSTEVLLVFYRSLTDFIWKFHWFSTEVSLFFTEFSFIFLQKWVCCLCKSQSCSSQISKLIYTNPKVSLSKSQSSMLYASLKAVLCKSQSFSMQISKLFYANPKAVLCNSQSCYMKVSKLL